MRNRRIWIDGYPKHWDARSTKQEWGDAKQWNCLDDVRLVTQILADVGLVIGDDLLRAGGPAIQRRFRGGAKSERHIRLGKDHDTGVRRGVLRDTAQMRLDDVVSIQEGLLASRLQPHLVPSQAAQVIEAGHREPEFARVGELAELDTSGDQILLPDAPRLLHELRTQIVDAVLMQAEDMLILGPVDQLLEVRANVFLQLLKDNARLFLGQCPHLGRCDQRAESALSLPETRHASQKRRFLFEHRKRSFFPQKIPEPLFFEERRAGKMWERETPF